MLGSRRWKLNDVMRVMTWIYFAGPQAIETSSPPLSSSSSSLTNVALHKPAAQSSSSAFFSTLTAAKAVDGDHTTSLYYCQHTADSTNGEVDNSPYRWWLVDLQGFYEVWYVKVTNRGDCCAFRLSDFDLQVFMLNPMTNAMATAHTCYHYNGPMGSGVTERLDCSQPIRGRYVRIILPSTGQAMHVCEVEVWAKTSDSTSTKYTRNQNHKALGNVLREVTSRSVIDCVSSCGLEMGCNAVNVKRRSVTSGGRSRICQLLSFGGITQTHTVNSDPEWDFYSVTDP